MISNMIQKYGYHPNRSCTQFLQLTVNWFATVTLNSQDQNAVRLLQKPIMDIWKLLNILLRVVLNLNVF